MNLSKLIPELKKYKKVVVSGPQRSGTTIAAKILASELGYEFAIEETFHVFSATSFFKLLCKKNNMVIQAPAMSHLLGEIDRPDTAIVFMIRDNKEIRESEQRVNYKCQKSECEKYFMDHSNPAMIKKMMFILYQAPRLEGRYYFLNYKSLQGHSLWIDQEQRAGFHHRQTE